MIRVVVNEPPKWYRKLCAQHPSRRRVRRGKFDTRIRRREILSVLRVLCSGKMSQSIYAKEILREAKARAMCPF